MVTVNRLSGVSPRRLKNLVKKFFNDETLGGYLLALDKTKFSMEFSAMSHSNAMDYKPKTQMLSFNTMASDDDIIQIIENVLEHEVLPDIAQNRNCEDKTVEGDFSDHTPKRESWDKIDYLSIDLDDYRPRESRLGNNDPERMQELINMACEEDLEAREAFETLNESKRPICLEFFKTDAKSGYFPNLDMLYLNPDFKDAVLVEELRKEIKRVVKDYADVNTLYGRKNVKKNMDGPFILLGVKSDIQKNKADMGIVRRLGTQNTERAQKLLNAAAKNDGTAPFIDQINQSGRPITISLETEQFEKHPYAYSFFSNEKDIIYLNANEDDHDLVDILAAQIKNIV